MTVTLRILSAVKYSEPDSPVLLALGWRGGDGVITVRDHGIGIPQHDRAPEHRKGRRK